MIRNVGTSDRLLRGLASLALISCAFASPLPLVARIAAFAIPGGYMLLTALLGRCAGYALLGKSSCPLESR